MSTIDDGSGKGFKARVTPEQQLDVNNLPDEVRLLVAGDVYNYNTGDIELTTDTPSAVQYLKNNGDRDILITAFIYLLGSSTGGSGNIKIEIIKDPTAGTLVSGGTEAEPVNRNFGSDVPLDAEAHNGAEGLTFTDGSPAIQSIFASAGRYVVGVSVCIPRGKAVGIKITPPTGNTSMTCQFALPLLRLSAT